MHACEVNSFPIPPGAHTTHSATHTYTRTDTLQSSDTASVAVSEAAADKIGLGCTACRQILLWHWQETETGWDAAALMTCLCLSLFCLFECFALSPPSQRMVFPKWLGFFFFPLNECLFSVPDWVASCALHERVCLPKFSGGKKRDPYCRLVCILPFGAQTGQGGDCTSCHYCIVLNEGPVTDPQTHWPSSVFYPRHRVQVLHCVHY